MSTMLAELQNLCLQLSDTTFANKLDRLCQFFLNTPYGYWKDGSNLESLDDFNYQLDLLDCVLFVEVVLALIKTNPGVDSNKFVRNFEDLLRHIHYADGKPNFLARNHFFCVDWIPNNKLIVEDITHLLWPGFKTATTIINKPEFIKRQKVYKHGNMLIPEQVQPISSVVPYIDTEDLLQNQKYFLEIFPEYCIVNIVRPNWDLTERIGTHLNISHLGVALNRKPIPEITFYHATIIEGLVKKDTLFDYMYKHRDSPTIRGINVLAIKSGY